VGYAWHSVVLWDSLHDQQQLGGIDWLTAALAAVLDVFSQSSTDWIHHALQSCRWCSTILVYVEVILPWLTTPTVKTGNAVCYL
jgi:hypothetical protein